MKDRRTRDKILKALKACEANLEAANKETSGLMREKTELLHRIEEVNKAYRNLDEKYRKLLEEKNGVYGVEWVHAKTREASAERRAAILRGALVALAGKQKADEIEAETPQREGVWLAS